MNSKTTFFRKWLAVTLVFCLVCSLWPAQVYADSRAAIVEKVAGNAYIQKSGGKKEFIAYKGMALAKGDRIRTEDHSSIELRTSDSDDLLVIGENSTLFISELFNSGKKKSGFKMWTGFVFAKVASLFQSDDEYRIETPNAVMGVRGTHFTVMIDPSTGLPTLFVNAGTVGVFDPNASDEEQFVLPAQQITVYPGNESGTEDRNPITFIDIEQFLEMADVSVIERLLRNKRDIDQENEQMMDQMIDQLYMDGYLASGEEGVPLQEEIDRLRSNLENLVDNIVHQAVNQGRVTSDEINRIIDEISKDTPDFDFSMDRDVPPMEQLRGERNEEQQRLLEERRRKQQEIERQREEHRRNQQQSNQDLLDRIREQQDELAQKNNEAREEAQRRATEQFLEQLSEDERRRFEESTRKRSEEREQAADEQNRRRSIEDSPSQPEQPSRPPEPGAAPGTIVELEIESIAEVHATIRTGQSFAMPSTVQATYSNGRTTEVPVSWSPSAPEWSNPGIYEFHAEVSNSDKLAKLTVTVEADYDTVIQLSKLAGNQLPLPGGVVIDFGGKTFSEQAAVTVKPSSEASNASQKGLERAGAVLQFDFNGVDWSENEEVIQFMFPLAQNADANRTAMFRFLDDGNWEYVPTNVNDRLATAEVTQFSTFGLFMADESEKPAIVPASGLVNRGDAFVLESSEENSALYYKIGTNWIQYGEPVPITNGWSVAAQAVSLNKRPSAVTNVNYTTVQPSASLEQWNEMDVYFSETVQLQLIEESIGAVPVITVGGQSYRIEVVSSEGARASISDARADDHHLTLTLEEPASGTYELLFYNDENELRTPGVVLNNPHEEPPIDLNPKASVVHNGGEGIVEIGSEGLDLSIIVQNLTETYGLQIHVLHEPLLTVSALSPKAEHLLERPVQFTEQFEGWAPKSDGDGFRWVNEIVYAMLTDYALQTSWTIDASGEAVLELTFEPGFLNPDVLEMPDADGYYYGTISLIDLFGVDAEGNPIVVPVESGTITFKIHESQFNS